MLRASMILPNITVFVVAIDITNYFKCLHILCSVLAAQAPHVHVLQRVELLLASLAGLLGTLLASGLAYSIRLPERKLYPRSHACTLGLRHMTGGINNIIII